MYSPNYPNDYFNSADVSWQIRNQYGNYVEMEVMIMNLESCCDYVRIYDGSSVGSPLLVSLSGSNNNGNTYYSSGSFMYVRFTSEGSVTRRGFQLRYRGTYTTSTPSPYPNGTGFFYNRHYDINLEENKLIVRRVFRIFVYDIYMTVYKLV